MRLLCDINFSNAFCLTVFSNYMYTFSVGSSHSNVAVLVKKVIEMNALC